eukprot:CAMPEP_0168550696 /NCGR_PEP_ID=MMETSP0413-20121227/5779_1 /TAXON_ID=136452 /ORGANISM="Filamoeba nolandi, Strain NC-AS-23-1" /LENGTH=83 /DNA_ID=CAMNT_0008581177 /DNA_START=467 /DNA_END=718 /DNA_ORIENTATION=-
MIKFEEDSVLQGTGVIPMRNLFQGNMDISHVSMFGNWACNDQKGQFRLHLTSVGGSDLDNSQVEVKIKCQKHPIVKGVLVKLV